jgi:CRISPR-associated protein Csm3
MKDLILHGRIILSGRVRAVSGLHIGGSPGALAIGNVDLPVIREAVSGRPYIPGSSLKGKMRSLAEKLTGAPQNRDIGQVTIHVAGGDRRQYRSDEEYQRAGRKQYDAYWVNPVFGVPGEIGFEIPAPTRLVVRDVPLWDDQETILQNVKGKSAQALLQTKTDLPYSEIKWEAAIDRVTAAAVPRQMERVPAGAVFAPLELVFSVFQVGDLDLFSHVLTALKLVEDDYLGGQGSRGSGKVAFEGLHLTVRGGVGYETVDMCDLGDLADLSEEQRKEALAWLKQKLPVS